MILSRRDFLASAAISLAGSVPAAASTIGIGGPAFGSSWRIALPGGSQPHAVRAVVDAIITGVNASMSPYVAGSELSRFNRSGSLDWQACSPELAQVASEAISISRLTGGAFDPTIGPLVGRFGFGPIHGDRGRPEDLSASASAVRKAAPGLTMDLCGIAKGFALDRIAESLPPIGVTAALIELGGEVRTLGRHPEGRSWQVGIEQPDGADGGFRHIVDPNGLALATSGTGRQSVAFAGRGVSHLIEPHSGRPLEAAPASVSVLAPTAMQADALSTALMVMGAEAGAEFAEAHGIPALFIVKNGKDWRDIMTAGFSRHVLI